MPKDTVQVSDSDSDEYESAVSSSNNEPDKSERRRVMFAAALPDRC